MAAGELVGLGPGWTTFHDVRWPGRRLATIDDVVIGPGGVFVLDRVHWTGNVTTTGGVLRLDGYRRERPLGLATEAARAVAGLVGPHASPVHPVLCLSNQREVRGRAGGVLICSSDNVAEMLASRPRVLTTAKVADAVSLLRDRLEAPARAAR